MKFEIDIKKLNRLIWLASELTGRDSGEAARLDEIENTLRRVRNNPKRRKKRPANKRPAPAEGRAG